MGFHFITLHPAFVIGELGTARAGSLDQVAFQVSEKKLADMKKEIDTAIRVLGELKATFSDRLMATDDE